MLRVCCFILFLVADTRQLSISEFVVPQSVEVGQNAELRCQYDLSDKESHHIIFVKWWWTPASGDDRKQLYQRNSGNHAVSTQHELNTEIKDDTIILLDVQPKASGIYECEVSDIDEVRRHQELIVYTKGTGPQLNISSVDDQSGEDEAKSVRITCEASDVSPAPDVAITINGKEVNITEIVQGPDETGFYSIYANKTIQEKEVDQAEISCKLLFVHANITDTEFVDSILFDPLGALTSTEVPEDTIFTNTTSESLQNTPDVGSPLRYSWTLMLIFPVLQLLSMCENSYLM